MGLVSIHLATEGTAQILVFKSFRFGVASRICGKSIFNQFDFPNDGSTWLLPVIPWTRSINCWKCSSVQVNAFPTKNFPLFPLR